MSPVHETQSMWEIRLLRRRLPRKGGGLTGMISWRLSQLYHGGYLSYIMAVISVISWWLSQLYHGGYLSYIMAVISVISWRLLVEETYLPA